MSQATPTYQLPYPDLTDTPNIPSDVQALALQVEAVLTPVDARARLGRIVCGELVGDGNTGIHKVTLPFTPQLVEIVTQITTPLASSLIVSSISVGRIGRATDGTITQYVTGTRNLPGSGGSAERRTLRTQCAGVIIDDTTLYGNAIGNLLADGFTLDVQDGHTNISYFWTGHE